MVVMKNRNGIIREQKIFLKEMSDNGYEVLNDSGEVLLGSEEDYFIYFKNVNFKLDGTINGRYLGIADDNLIDGYARDVMFDKDDGVWKTIDKRNIRTARMVAVNNKKNITIIIQNNK